jgi:hypothetical protein
MKNIFKIYLLLLAGLMASCLEDDKFALDPSDTKNVIEFMDPSVPASPSGAIYPAYATSFVFAPSAELEQIISFSGPNDNNEDITLTLAVDPVALEEYNRQMHDELHGQTYDLMPADNYDLETTTVTIPKGQTKTSLTITVYPEKFDFARNFAIPLRIVSASSGVLSAHNSTVILAVGVRNNYDGIYEIIGGNIQRNSATGPDPVLSGDYVPGLTLNATTLSSNQIAFQPYWKDGSGIGGIDGTFATINESTNAVTMASATNATLKNIPGAINVYDPATRTFTLNFDWGAAPSNRVITGLQLRWIGPRP